MKLAFLDRDGVLNVRRPDVYFVTRVEELQLTRSAGPAVAALQRAGYRVIVITNQRAVSEGLLSLSELDRLHTNLQQLIAAHGGKIDAFYVCPHARDVCDCRKPKPGLLLTALRDHPGAELASCFFVGDSETDRQAAEAIGLDFIDLETNGDLMKRLLRAGVVASEVA